MLSHTTRWFFSLLWIFKLCVCFCKTIHLKFGLTRTAKIPGSGALSETVSKRRIEKITPSLGVVKWNIAWIYRVHILNNSSWEMYPPMIHQRTLQSWKIIESQSEKHSNAITHPNKHLFSYLFPLQHVISAVWSGALGLEQKSTIPHTFRGHSQWWGRGASNWNIPRYNLPKPSGWGDTQRTTPGALLLINHQSWEFKDTLRLPQKKYMLASLKALVIDDHASEPLKEFATNSFQDLQKTRFGLPILRLLLLQLLPSKTRL